MSNKKKAIREEFNRVCMERDKGKCRICNEKGTEVHHVTDRTLLPNGGYVLENGITLCNDCHINAERFHISGGTAWVGNMHPDDLYKMIGSSKEKAIKASEKI